MLKNNRELAEIWPEVPRYAISKDSDIRYMQKTETGKECVIILGDEEKEQIEELMETQGCFEDAKGKQFLLDETGEIRCYFVYVNLLEVRPNTETNGDHMDTPSGEIKAYYN